MRRIGKPKKYELVVCRVTKLYPNSAQVEMIQYDNMKGMVHVSEVAKKWIRDIRDFLRESQYVVCKVMNVEGHTISLSVKRVHKDEANRKLNEFKREKRSEKLLEMAGKSLELSLLARHALDLSQKFHAIYHRHPILQETDENLRQARLATTQIFMRGLETLADLLGLPLPKRM